MAAGVQTFPTSMLDDADGATYLTIKVTGKAGKATILSAGQTKPVKLLKADALPGMNFTGHIISDLLLPPR